MRRLLKWLRDRLDKILDDRSDGGYFFSDEPPLVWLAADNPHIVDEPMTVSDAWIEDGVEVHFLGDGRLTVEGRLRANNALFLYEHEHPMPVLKTSPKGRAMIMSCVFDELEAWGIARSAS